MITNEREKLTASNAVESNWTAISVSYEKMMDFG